MNSDKQLWVVVKVESGIPVLAEIYENLDMAEAREQELRLDINESDDEIGIFETQVNVPNKE